MTEMLKNFETEQEVYEYYKKTNRKIVLFEGTVYDVEDYMDLHPGGSDMIEELLGKPIDDAFID